MFFNFDEYPLDSIKVTDTAGRDYAWGSRSVKARLPESGGKAKDGIKRVRLDEATALKHKGLWCSCLVGVVCVRHVPSIDSEPEPYPCHAVPE